MIRPRDGDTVKVHYTGKLGNGEVVSTSEGGPPLEVNIGSEGHIRGFEKGLIGMKLGETKTIVVPPEEGHGPTREELILRMPKTDFLRVLHLPLENECGCRKKRAGILR